MGVYAHYNYVIVIIVVRILRFGYDNRVSRIGRVRCIASIVHLGLLSLRYEGRLLLCLGYDLLVLGLRYNDRLAAFVCLLALRGGSRWQPFCGR